MRLFFYGTLMDFDVLATVLGRTLDHISIQEARLAFHGLRVADGYTFPVLVPVGQSTIKGVCVEGLTAQDVDRIRYFEDVEYELKPLSVEVGGQATEAHAFCPNERIRVSAKTWDFARWQKHDKPLLLSITREVFARHYGVTGIDQIDAVWHDIKARHERPKKPAMRRARRRIA